ncbi:hypothetical protein B296_00047451 [Ensete ventricosum]|uniref:Uncharacterized protein n=1 Tax=Ensete ventricosum TaxID=4639 RepID=A0A426YZG9_ENSVE|nr:hypothetical protein B296_00047451 [Ensete ventricosum]
MSSSLWSLPLLSFSVHEERKDMNGEHQVTSRSAPLGRLAKGVGGGEPIGEAVECPRVGPVVALRELHELRPREVRVQPSAAEVPRRWPDGAVLPGAHEESQRLPLSIEMKERQQVTYHEGVTNVDHQSVANRPDRPPLVGGEDLEALHLVLLKDGQRGGIAVRPGAERQLRLLTWRIVVASHYGATVLEEVSVMASLHS